jgi:hypothetical protein
MGAPRGRAVWVDGSAGFAPLAAGLPRDAHAMALAAMGGRLLMGTMSEGIYSKTPRGASSRLADRAHRTR